MNLDIIPTLTFKSGSHRPQTITDPTTAEMCVMEAVAYIAGEPWSDHPQCVCPVIAAFMRSWNDGLPTDDDRTRLLAPLIPVVIGTASTPDAQDRRAIAAADWAVRTYTPAWLRLAGLTTHADTLAALPELDTIDALRAATVGPIKDARQAAAAAGDAAWDAAGAAAWDAAGAAARAAAGAAAWDAARAAARAAAGAAAWDAAEAAAGDAAGDAAGAALADTVASLQESASGLVRRLATIGGES